MAKLYLQRHLKSQWNLEDRFAGWTDGPLSKEGLEMAKTAAEKLSGLPIDVAFTSPLIRNMQTVISVLGSLGDRYPLFKHLDGGNMQKRGNYTDIGGDGLQVYVSENLNERYYGKLQGLNKAETKKKYGEDKVLLWRTSYDVAPPGGESGEDVYKRVVPFYKKKIEKELKAGRNVLIITSHHPLRAIVKYIEKIPTEKMIGVEIPFGGLVKYEFNNGIYRKI